MSVTSVDTSVDGVHFRLADGWMTPRDVGWRSLAVALSDLAAMGAQPGEAYIALALAPGFGDDAALELMRGANAVARHTKTTIAGGDVVSAPVLMVSVTVVGWANSPDELTHRNGALVGDLVGVTGELGGAGAALALLRSGDVIVGSSPAWKSCVQRLRTPVPRLAQGSALAGAGAHAMIDLSDGLATDAKHLGEASGAHVRVRLADLPVQAGVAEIADRLGLDPVALACAAGDDYELCVCVAPSDCHAAEQALEKAGNVGVTWIGEVVDGAPGLTLLDAHGAPVPMRGFEHRTD